MVLLESTKKGKNTIFVIPKSHIITSVARLAWHTAVHVPTRIWSRNDRIIIILNVLTREVTDGNGHWRVVCVSVFAFKLVLNVCKFLTRLLLNLSENPKRIFRCATYTTTLKWIKYVERLVRLRGKPCIEGFAPKFSPVFWFFWDSNFFRPAIVVFVTIRTWTFKRRDSVFDDANIILLYAYIVSKQELAIGPNGNSKELRRKLFGCIYYTLHISVRRHTAENAV